MQRRVELHDKRARQFVQPRTFEVTSSIKVNDEIEVIVKKQKLTPELKPIQTK